MFVRRRKEIDRYLFNYVIKVRFHYVNRMNTSDVRRDSTVPVVRLNYLDVTRLLPRGNIVCNLKMYVNQTS